MRVRIPDGIIDEIRKAASRDRRSIAQEVIWLLEEALKTHAVAAREEARLLDQQRARMGLGPPGRL